MTLTSSQVTLTHEELLLLADYDLAPDVIVSAANEVRHRRMLSGHPWVAKVLWTAEKEGAVTVSYALVRRCSVCGWEGGYVQYKSGRSKGLPNYGKPRRRAGVKGSYGTDPICRECWDKVRPEFTAAAQIAHAVVRGLVNNRKEQYVAVHCTVCDWRGWEDELGPLPALFYGTYPGQCPDCGAQNKMFGVPKITRDYKRWKIVCKALGEEVFRG